MDECKYYALATFSSENDPSEEADMTDTVYKAL